MRVVFFGTPDFAVPTLDALLASGAEVVGVVTQPDRPRTRSHSTLLPSPVKSRALEAGLPVWQPERPRGEEFYATMRDANADLGVVVAYGHLLRPELLAIPRLGMVNVHASLLPRWRGAAPIHWAVLSGDSTTGVSIMRMEEGLDSGPVWHQVAIPIHPSDTTGSLFERLAMLGGTALVETLPAIASGAAPVPQDEALVTLAPKINRELARIDWHQPAAAVARHINAMDPSPGAWTMWQDTPIKLNQPLVSTVLEPALVPPGTLACTHLFLLVACTDTWLCFPYVHQAGKHRMHSDDWLVRNPGAVGTRFE